MFLTLKNHELLYKIYVKLHSNVEKTHVLNNIRVN